MEQTREYIVGSLEQHLFFARIMKEHSLFLKAGFLPPGAAPAAEAEGFLREFETLLSRAAALGDCVVRRRVLASGELVTEFTDLAECQTQKLTGIPIDRQLTARVAALKGGDDARIPRSLAGQVRQLNRDGLRLVE